jgi:hypothetical protein
MAVASYGGGGWIPILNKFSQKAVTSMSITWCPYIGPGSEGLGIGRQYVTRFWRIVLIYDIKLDASEKAAMIGQRENLCDG